METKKFRKLEDVQADHKKEKGIVNSVLEEKFNKVDISRVAASSLQAGMNLEETKRFIANVLGSEPPDWLMEKIREKRKIIKESTSSKALGF